MGKRLRPSLALLALCWLPIGCNTVPPGINRSYVQLRIDGSGHSIEAAENDGTGPFPGAGFLFGTLFQLDGTSGVFGEVGGKVSDLDQGGDLEGTSYHLHGGLRRTFRLDRPLQYSLSGGLAWHEFKFQNTSSDFDFRGPGAYVGGAVDYLIRPSLSIGAEFQVHFFDANGDETDEFSVFSDLGIRLQYRF